MSRIVLCIIIMIVSFSIISGNGEINHNSHPSPDIPVFGDSQIPESGQRCTRAGGQEGNTSFWTDSFEDRTKINSLIKTTVENGQVKLIAGEGEDELRGSVISNPVDMMGDGMWLKFYSNETILSSANVITIDNSLNPEKLENYPVEIIFDTETFISSGFMRPDCGDIRFTGESGKTLPYWIESGINTKETKIWVKVDQIPGSSKVNIYLSFGDPGLESQSNGEDTFDFFDGFEAGNFDKWEELVYTSGIYGIKNGILFMNTSKSTETGGIRLQEKTHAGLNENYMIAWDFRLVHDEDLSSADVFWGNYDWNNGYGWRVESYPDSTNDLYEWYNYRIYTESNRYYIERKLEYEENWEPLKSEKREAVNESTFGKFTISVGHSIWHLIATEWDNIRIQKLAIPAPTVSVESVSTNNEADITYTILDNIDDEELMTVENGDVLTDLDTKSIKLKAELHSKGMGLVRLHDWGVEFNTFPMFPYIKAPDHVYRGRDLYINISMIDEEDPEDILIMDVRYRSQTDDLFKTDYIIPFYFNNSKWRTIFSPPLAAETGDYTFIFSSTDSYGGKAEYQYDFVINVMNNRPSKPEVAIITTEPTTLDNLNVLISNVDDIETTLDKIEFWVRWYSNNRHMEKYDNKTTLPSTATSDKETWRVEVFLYDGENNGPPGIDEIKINNPPGFVEEPETKEEESIFANPWVIMTIILIVILIIVVVIFAVTSSKGKRSEQAYHSSTAAPPPVQTYPNEYLYVDRNDYPDQPHGSDPYERQPLRPRQQSPAQFTQKPPVSQLPAQGNYNQSRQQAAGRQHRQKPPPREY